MNFKIALSVVVGLGGGFEFIINEMIFPFIIIHRHLSYSVSNRGTFVSSAKIWLVERGGQVVSWC